MDFSEFSLSGVSTGALWLALTFAILSTAGFEGAAEAGEETRNPTRNVPWVILATAMGVWSCGTTTSELQAFVSTALGDRINLSRRWSTPVLGT